MGRAEGCGALAQSHGASGRTAAGILYCRRGFWTFDLNRAIAAFRCDLEQSTPHGLHRLIGIGEEFQLQVKLTDNWTPIYQFSLQEQLPADWEVQNWFTSTHPDSTFTNSLMVARPVGDLRYALLNDRLSMHHPDGTVERRTARGGAELASFLQSFFDIRLPCASDELLRRFAKDEA